MIGAQNTRDIFGIEEGNVIKYRINEAKTEITYETLSDTFRGLTYNESVKIEEDTTLKVMVESITGTELKWYSSYGLDAIEGTFPVTADFNTFLDFLLLAIDVYMNVDISNIYSSGVIESFNFDLFIIPLFLDTAPLA